MTPHRLSAALVRDQVVTFRQMDDALTYQREFGGRVATILFQLHGIDEYVLLEYLGRTLGIEPADASLFGQIDPDILQLLEPQEMHSLGAIPIAKIDGRVIILSADPPDDVITRRVEALVRAKVEPRLILDFRFHQALNTLYQMPLPARYGTLHQNWPSPFALKPGAAPLPKSRTGRLISSAGSNPRPAASEPSSSRESLKEAMDTLAKDLGEAEDRDDMINLFMDFVGRFSDGAALLAYRRNSLRPVALRASDREESFGETEIISIGDYGEIATLMSRSGFYAGAPVQQEYLSVFDALGFRASPTDSLFIPIEVARRRVLLLVAYQLKEPFREDALPSLLVVRSYLGRSLERVAARLREVGASVPTSSARASAPGPAAAPAAAASPQPPSGGRPQDERPDAEPAPAQQAAQAAPAPAEPPALEPEQPAIAEQQAEPPAQTKRSTLAPQNHKAQPGQISAPAGFRKPRRGTSLLAAAYEPSAAALFFGDPPEDGSAAAAPPPPPRRGYSLLIAIAPDLANAEESASSAEGPGLQVDLAATSDLDRISTPTDELPRGRALTSAAPISQTAPQKRALVTEPELESVAPKSNAADDLTGEWVKPGSSASLAMPWSEPEHAQDPEPEPEPPQDAEARKDAFFESAMKIAHDAAPEVDLDSVLADDDATDAYRAAEAEEQVAEVEDILPVDHASYEEQGTVPNVAAAANAVPDVAEPAAAADEVVTDEVVTDEVVTDEDFGGILDEAISTLTEEDNARAVSLSADAPAAAGNGAAAHTEPPRAGAPASASRTLALGVTPGSSSVSSKKRGSAVRSFLARFGVGRAPVEEGPTAPISDEQPSGQAPNSMIAAPKTNTQPQPRLSGAGGIMAEDSKSADQSQAPERAEDRCGDGPKVRPQTAPIHELSASTTVSFSPADLDPLTQEAAATPRPKANSASSAAPASHRTVVSARPISELDDAPAPPEVADTAEAADSAAASEAPLASAPARNTAPTRGLVSAPFEAVEPQAPEESAAPRTVTPQGGYRRVTPHPGALQVTPPSGPIEARPNPGSIEVTPHPSPRSVGASGTVQFVGALDKLKGESRAGHTIPYSGQDLELTPESESSNPGAPGEDVTHAPAGELAAVESASEEIAPAEAASADEASNAEVADEAPAAEAAPEAREAAQEPAAAEEPAPAEAAEPVAAAASVEPEAAPEPAADSAPEVAEAAPPEPATQPLEAHAPPGRTQTKPLEVLLPSGTGGTLAWLKGARASGSARRTITSAALPETSSKRRARRPDSKRQRMDTPPLPVVTPKPASAVSGPLKAEPGDISAQMASRPPKTLSSTPAVAPRSSGISGPIGPPPSLGVSKSTSRVVEHPEIQVPGAERPAGASTKKVAPIPASKTEKIPQLLGAAKPQPGAISRPSRIPDADGVQRDETGKPARVAFARNTEPVDLRFTVHDLDLEDPTVFVPSKEAPEPHSSSSASERSPSESMTTADKIKQVRDFCREIVNGVIAGDPDSVRRMDVALRSASMPLMHEALIQAFPGPLQRFRKSPAEAVDPVEHHGPLLAVMRRRLSLLRPVLRKLLSSGNDDARYYALRLAACTGDGEFVVACAASRLLDSDSQIRQAALGLVEDARGTDVYERALDALRQAMLGRDPWKIEHAAQLVSKLGDIESVEPLVRLLDHPSDRLRQRVQRALVELTFADFGPDMRAWRRWWLANNSKPRMEWLADGMTRDSVRVREAAAAELRRHPGLKIEYDPYGTAASWRMASLVFRRRVLR